MILYYITDRIALASDEPTRRRRLLAKIAEAARAAVDYIQLREKDLPTRELEALAWEAIRVIAQLGRENREPRTRLLVNSRTDVALAAGTDGVHLRSEDVSPEDVKQIWTKWSERASARENSPPVPLIGVSCHSREEVAKASTSAASFAVFAPVFEKGNVPPAGLKPLTDACKEKIPVLALGGITIENARSCHEAGAAGIAAIRLFQDNSIQEIVKALRRG
ncbi:MAG: thiamine phosphate synthase [Candidatus Sulfotelmatobacter sp.]